MSNNRYNPNGYKSLRVTPISCGLEAPKRHGKKTRFFIHLLIIRPSVVITNKDLLKTRLIFNFYAQMSCKIDWNNFLLLNTIVPLNVAIIFLLALMWSADTCMTC